jgi:hypothetical protein
MNEREYTIPGDHEDLIQSLKRDRRFQQRNKMNLLKDANVDRIEIRPDGDDIDITYFFVDGRMPYSFREFTPDSPTRKKLEYLEDALRCVLILNAKS